MLKSLSRSTTVSAPASEPLSRSEVKKQLEIADAVTTHDDQLDSLITSAREQWERDTNRITVQTTVVEKLNQEAFFGTSFTLTHRPIISITSISYYDSANAIQTLATSVYDLDAPNRRVSLQYDQVWPSLTPRWDAVTVTYLAGKSTVPELDKSAMKLLVFMDFADADPATLDRYQRAYDAMVLKNIRSTYP